jgi:hypothetical protein
MDTNLVDASNNNNIISKNILDELRKQDLELDSKFNPDDFKIEDKVNTGRIRPIDLQGSRIRPIDLEGSIKKK